LQLDLPGTGDDGIQAWQWIDELWDCGSRERDLRRLGGVGTPEAQPPGHGQPNACCGAELEELSSTDHPVFLLFYLLNFSLYATKNGTAMSAERDLILNISLDSAKRCGQKENLGANRL
jgi:hypothetical protein